jgi:phosphoenolpyruvate carboxylase
MARARFVIARRYADAAPGRVHEKLAAEFERAEHALLRITGQERLLAHSPVIEKSIRLRNPYTDVLNLVQLDLLRRWREGGADGADAEPLREALFVSLNGIAAAMQSTG